MLESKEGINELNITNHHVGIRGLVENNVLVPGIFTKEYDMVIFDPISIQEYERKIIEHDLSNLAYHTISMRRGIFTFNELGQIVNYKGVDSRANTDDVNLVNITKILNRHQERHNINVVYFKYGKKPQIRVTGASQLQDLVSERDKIEKLKLDPLIKLPRIVEIRAFSRDFCAKYNLPSYVVVDNCFIEKQKLADAEDKKKGIVGKTRMRCLCQMDKLGMPDSTRNQTWHEYYSSLSNEEQFLLQKIDSFQAAVEEEDRRYSLGAVYGQAVRIIECPFRISDIELYLIKRDKNSLKEIVDYLLVLYGKDYLLNYAELMGRNVACFMNNDIANHLWAHRQDFALSGEICDEAFNDVSVNLRKEDCSQQFKYLKRVIENAERNDIISCDTLNKYEIYRSIMTDKVKYYSQIFMFASNMKIIDAAFKYVGCNVPENYIDVFIDEFILSLKDIEIINGILFWYKKLFENERELELYLGKRAVYTIAEYEHFIKYFKLRLEEKYRRII